MVVSVLLTAVLTAIAEYVMAQNFPELYEELGIYLPLMAVSSVILSRVSEVSKNGSLAEALGDYAPIDKVTFSCCGNEEFLAAINKAKEEGRNSVIITGCETHICVEQTALDLLEMGFDVFLAADCVQSRTRENREISLRRMEKAGIVVSSYESMLYDMLGSAKAPEFKAISAIVK